MSGPITVAFGLDAGVLLLSQHAISEARAMQREYGEVLAQLRRREEELAAIRQSQREARLERIAATRREADRRLARLERLRALVGDAPEALSVPHTFTVPREDDDIAWTEYLRALEGAARELEKLLPDDSGVSAAEVLQGLLPGAPAQSLDEILAGYVR